MANEHPRITFDPLVMGGKACIRGMRVTVGMIVSSLATDATVEGILRDYPYLEREDIRQALGYAARLVDGEQIVPFAKAS